MCMRSLTYECLNLYSKRWALISATLLAQRCIKVVRRQLGVLPDRVSLQGISHLQGGSLGISRIPGLRNAFIKEAARAGATEMGNDFEQLKAYGVTHLLPVIKDSEFQSTGVSHADIKARADQVEIT